jgi:hypothetical protein
MDVAWHQLVLKYHQRNPLKLKNTDKEKIIENNIIYKQMLP